MKEAIAAKLAWLLECMYPERQIILRARGEVSFVAIGRNSQIGLSLMGLLVLGWLAYASAGIFLQQDIIAGKDNHIALMLSAHDRLNADMRAVERKYRGITANLADNQRLLGDALRQRAGLDRVRAELLQALGQTKKQRDLALDTSQALQDRLASLESSLRRSLDESSDLQTDLSQVTRQLADTKSEKERVRQERRNLAANLDVMRDNLSGLRKARQSLRQDLESSETMVSRLTDQRNNAISTKQALNIRIASLEDSLEQLHLSQRTLVGNIHDRTDANISELESIVHITSLNLDKLLRRVNGKQIAIGGPLLASGAEKQAIGELGLLENRLTRWSALNAVLDRLPITPPVDSYSISSRFGKRRDPFTKRKAFHGGVDLAGVRRTRVRATSPGVVTYVGWKGPYGRMVEIDHGLGLRTRYGHLHKILVKRGQKVDFRKKIGLMGTSGRSTGSHVHYEILFDGKPVDPMKFMKAGKYVFKG